jgi:hypothetical protein
MADTTQALATIRTFLCPLVKNWLALKGRLGPDARVCPGRGKTCGICNQVTFGSAFCVSCRGHFAGPQETLEALLERHNRCFHCLGGLDSRGICDYDCEGLSRYYNDDDDYEDAADSQWRDRHERRKGY